MSGIRRGHLHFDCVSGIAGDMTLGALFQLGVPREVVDAAVEAMGVAASRITCTPVVKSGIAAFDVRVDGDTRPERSERRDPAGREAPLETGDHSEGVANRDHPGGSAPHSHHHDHDQHHVHRSYADIREMIDRADLDDGTRRRAHDMFARIARAEAKLHGATLEEVHFHEVGAIDSIVDVVGAAAALAWMDPVSVSCASVSMGQGQVRCAHGILPVPSPAATEILREAGGIVRGGGIARELCTPTGAAILAATVTEWDSCPPVIPAAIGYGAGDAELEDRPNVVRVIAGQRQDRAFDAGGEVVVIEANIDDMSPEQAGYVAERLFDAGALDVWWTPITMKKSRPAFQVGVVAEPSGLDALSELLLRESTTLGVRYTRARRRVLERESVTVDTELGPLELVVARLGDEELRAVVEHEPARRIAEERGVPLREVYAAAERAYHRRRGGDG